MLLLGVWGFGVLGFWGFGYLQISMLAQAYTVALARQRLLTNQPAKPCRKHWGSRVSKLWELTPTLSPKHP